MASDELRGPKVSKAARFRLELTGPFLEETPATYIQASLLYFRSFPTDLTGTSWLQPSPTFLIATVVVFIGQLYRG